MSVFRKRDKICIVQQDDGEPYEHFIERGNFIVSCNFKDYEKAIIYSRMYINNKYLGCIYDDLIMEELKSND